MIRRASVEALNDLPIKSVNGATVRIGDVAFVHDSFPPQINMVRVDGANAVLMTIVKAGSASTLDVINGVKELLPRLREILPPEIKLAVVGDQSPFVQSAVNSVIFEGALAATLTGLMILIFLGSWRSTVIIIISIPLAILASITLLAATGENINVMTSGGLALAVGILVDDATVTIENINFQLEQKKEIEAAIMDGARQIVIPATVSLLCICIVFVPMFTLNGISGFLFRPMAKAVVFALMGSYLLSRTLVPTMANYLLGGHAHDPDAPPKGFSADSSGDSSTGSRRRGGLTRGRSPPPSPGAGNSLSAFWDLSRRRSSSSPFSARISSRRSRASSSSCTCAGRPGCASRNRGRLVTRIEKAIGEIAGPNVVATMVDNIGLPISGINAAYGNSGTIGSADADILITLEDGQEKKSEDLVRRLREKLPELFPGRDLRLSARRHRHANPQFRPARANRRASGRQ